MTLFLTKIYASLVISEGVGQIFGRCARDRDECEGRRRQTAILTHNFFFWPYHSVLSSRPHLALLLFGRRTLTQRPTVGRYSSGAPSHSLALPWPTALFWPQAETDSRLRLTVSHVGICIYHFITPTYFCSTTWLLPFIFSRAFRAENLWLTVRSRVNM